MWRGDGTLRQFFVYIMSNTSMTLYTGVTNDLSRRSSDHKNGIGSEFTSRYHFDRCVYFEIFESILEAIAREKQIKSLTRAKKIALVKTINPKWHDLTPSSS
ncbi:MAG: GIY-YIG nuclease family protein [Acidobacteriota bacterium]